MDRGTELDIFPAWAYNDSYQCYKDNFNAEQLMRWAKFVDSKISLNDELVYIWKDRYRWAVASYAQYCKDTGDSSLPLDLKFPQ